MTSSAGPRDQALAKQFGVRRFITKPLNLEDFLQIGQTLKEILLEGIAEPPSGPTSASAP